MNYTPIATLSNVQTTQHDFLLLLLNVKPIINIELFSYYTLVRLLFYPIYLISRLIL